MTLTLELTPGEEERLAAAAHRAGVAPVALLKKFVDGLPSITGRDAVSGDTEAGTTLRGLGMFAHVPGGSEEYAREKQAEVDREARSQE